MQPKIILGYSENLISLLLETLKATGATGPFQLLQNISNDSNVNIPFVPSGVVVDVKLPGEIFNKPDSGQYIFGVYTPEIKLSVYDYFLRSFEISMDNYSNLIHPSSVISSTVTMERGCYVEPLTIVSPFTSLGFGITINRGVTIGHHSKIEDFVSIGPGANIAGHTRIGENTTLGIGTVVFDHINIGKNCKIGGGSVVTKDIPDNVIAWGNPCKIIKTVDT